MLVENKSGVLTRISGLFARRGYNIESLSVCATEESEYSRMTVSVLCDEKTIEQIEKQLSKQFDVACITRLDENNSLLRELIIVKLNVRGEMRAQIMDICQIYNAKTVDLSVNTMTLELVGESRKIDAFVAVLAPYRIMELVRSGVTALSRGEDCIKNYRAEEKEGEEDEKN